MTHKENSTEERARELYQHWRSVHRLDDSARMAVGYKLAPYGICIMLQNGTGIPVPFDDAKAVLI